MEHVIQHGLSNAAAAALLAILAAIAARVWRNPHFGYALWLVVLLRLVAPPIVPVAVPLPASAVFHPTDATPIAAGGRSSAIEPLMPANRLNVRDANDGRLPIAPKKGTDPSANVSSVGTSSSGRGSLPFLGESRNGPAHELRESRAVSRLFVADLLAGIWLAGTIFYLALVGGRARRFARAAAGCRRDVPDSLRSEAAAAAATIGLRRLPRLALIEAALPPLVWPGWRPTVLLPVALIDSLCLSQRRLLLLHELEHIRRGAHRVRWFEIGVVALWWWNPIAWWAARRLERAEEECCDAAVLHFHPEQAAGYGQTLLAVSEFLSTGTSPAPIPSIGILRKDHLKRRLTMILNGPRWPRLSKTRFTILGILGAALIAVTWTAATAQNAPAQNVPAQNAPAQNAPAQNAPVPAAHSAPAPGPRRPEKPKRKRKPPRPVARAAQGLDDLLQVEPPKLEPRDDASLPLVQKFLRERYNAALRAVQLRAYQYEYESSPVSALCTATRNLADARLALADQPREKIQVVEWYVEFAKQTWNVADARLKAGAVTGFSPSDEAEARAARFEAEIKLLRLRAELKEADSKDAQSKEKQPERGTVAAAPPPAGQPPESEPLPALLTDKPLEPAPGDDDRQRLLKERYNAALRSLKAFNKSRESDPTMTVRDLTSSARQLLSAELAVAKPQDVARVYERYIDLMKFFERLSATSPAGSPTGRYAFETVHEARLDAEIKLLDAKSGRETADHYESQTPLMDRAVLVAKAELDSAKLTAEARAVALAQATASLSYRQIQYDRIVHLYEQKAIEVRLVDEARHTRDLAASAVKEAQAASRAAQSQVSLRQAQLDQLTGGSKTRPSAPFPATNSTRPH